MKNLRKYALGICFLLLLSCQKETASLTRFVDPLIGSGGHGHVFVGANVPFGMVQLGPTSIPQEWDWCSGYHNSDSTVIGFSHTHLSGTGIGDLFDVTVMPVIGDQLTYARGRENDYTTGLWSYADRSREIARPGYYSVPLTRYDIVAELTATTRVGMHRYTFPQSSEAAIVIDLINGGCWDRTMDTYMEVIDSVSVRGYRFSRGWADDQRIYFHAEFSVPFDTVSILRRDIQIWSDESRNLPVYLRADFDVAEGEQILMKVALSSVSMEGAHANMIAELPGWEFDDIVKEADQAWNKELSKVKVTKHSGKNQTAADADLLKIFYTSLYHTMIAPSVFSDVDGKYRGADGKIHNNPGFEVYTTLSLWDTYRAAMPLYSLYQPERYEDFINTMLAIYREQGKLPVWHLHGCETDCMVGNPGIPPVADAVVKGFGGIDKEQAFEAMKASAMRPDRGQDLRMKYGYIPCDLMNESVAYDLEYALADAAVANAAKQLGKEEDYLYFHKRSRSYRNLFDKEKGFIRGKDSKGDFRKDYSPFYSSHRADDYCEGNGWQYTWLVPHDLDGLADCFGSMEAMTDKLDSLFLVSSVIEGDDVSPDISGLIGQYAHGNEPSHHILYLYAMAGQPEKTADKVRQVLAEMYSSRPDGLSGNEDVGQMSAWYVMSSLGLYQVEPASGRYWFGSPIFDKAEIEVGKDLEGNPILFVIEVKGNSGENCHIESMTLNGLPYDKPYIYHKDIASGSRLIINMR